MRVIAGSTSSTALGAVCALAAALATVTTLTACGEPTPPKLASSTKPPEVVTNLVPFGSAVVNSTALPLDPKAKEEFLARVPAALSGTSPTGTLVGTKVVSSAYPSASAAASASAGSSRIVVEPARRMSSFVTERDLRSTLHFDLVEQCRAPGGAILPPDSVEIDFRVDNLGRIDRTSVRTKALKPEHDNAARCMARVIRAADAKFSVSRSQEATHVEARVPLSD
jgi:hypothetical protein